MLEATLDVRKDQGSVMLDLVKGGRHFRCHLDVQTGQATLAIDGLPDFAPTAQTAVRGVGRYRVAWANVDRQLLLWVDGRLVEFSTPTTYDDLDNALPTVDDLAPAGIAARGADVKVEHLLLKRDVYYIAANATDEHDSDYDFPGSRLGSGEDCRVLRHARALDGRQLVLLAAERRVSAGGRPVFHAGRQQSGRARIAGCGPTAAIRSITCGANC